MLRPDQLGYYLRRIGNGYQYHNPDRAALSGPCPTKKAALKAAKKALKGMIA